jgi:hypothetical protein
MPAGSAAARWCSRGTEVPRAAPSIRKLVGAGAGGGHHGERYATEKGPAEPLVLVIIHSLQISGVEIVRVTRLRCGRDNEASCPQAAGFAFADGNPCAVRFGLIWC